MAIALELVLLLYLACTFVCIDGIQCPKECLCSRGHNNNREEYLCRFPFLHDGLNFSMIKNDHLQNLTIQCDSTLFRGAFANSSFAGTPNLEMLVVQNCALSEISPFSFQGLDSLKTLSLQHVGSSNFGPKMNMGWSHPLKSIREITIVDGGIQRLSNEEFCTKPFLYYLDLGRNSISSFQDIGVHCPNISSQNATTDKELAETNLANFTTATFTPNQPPISQLSLASNVVVEIDMDLQLYLPSLLALRLENNGLGKLQTGVGNLWTKKLSYLFLGNNSLTNMSVPDKLDDLKHLYILDISANRIERLPHDIFQFASGLVYLNLSANFLTSKVLNESRLSDLQQLQVLDVSRNPLRMLNVYMTELLLNIEDLDVSNCNLSIIEHGTLLRMGKLRSLKVNNNRLTIKRNLTLDTFKNLETLILSHNKFLDFAVFKANARLRNLQIADVGIKRVPLFLGDSSGIIYLGVEKNHLQKLSHSDFKKVLNLRELNLSENQVTAIGEYVFYYLKQLQVLNLSHNRISSIEYSAFQGLGNLKSLFLDNNGISDIDVFLVPLSALTQLSISNNKLKMIPDQMLPTTLQVANFAYNSISYIRSGAFKMLPNLRLVDLSDNLITTLTIGALWMSSEAFPRPQVFLARNWFECDCQLHWLRRINSPEPHPFYHTPLVPDLSRLLCKEPLASGFWLVDVKESDLLCSYKDECDIFRCNCCNEFDPEVHCHCIAYCFEQCSCLKSLDANINILDCTGRNITSSFLLDEQKRPISARKLKFDNNKLESVDSRMFDYGLTTHLYLNDSMINLIQAGSFEKLSYIEKIFLQDNNITIIHIDTFGTLLHLNELHLERNSIFTIVNGAFKHLPSLMILNLFGNNLKQISIPEFQKLVSLEYLTLYDNPFECDCTYGPNLKYFLSASSKFIDRVDDVFCYHNPNETRENAQPGGAGEDSTIEDNRAGSEWESVIRIDFSYCSPYNIRYVPNQAKITASVVSTTAFFAIVILISIFIYKDRLLIRIWFYNKFGCFGNTDHEDENNKPYDIYLTCPEEDESLLYEQIIPKLALEGTGYKLCLEARDWPVGEFRTDSIIASIKQSKRTLLVITPMYFEDEWSQYVFKTAHHQVLLEKRRHLILIVMDKTLVPQMDANMRLYIRTSSYVVFGTQWFWEKLRYYLPAKPRGHSGSQDMDLLNLGL